MMWMVCGILSVVFCVTGFAVMSKKKTMAYWTPGCSLAFVSLTLLMEYKQVLNWVNKEDWSALLDVVPFMFLPLSIYVVIMLLANALLISCIKKKQ